MLCTSPWLKLVVYNSLLSIAENLRSYQKKKENLRSFDRERDSSCSETPLDVYMC